MSRSGPTLETQSVLDDAVLGNLTFGPLESSGSASSDRSKDRSGNFSPVKVLEPGELDEQPEEPPSVRRLVVIPN